MNNRSHKISPGKGFDIHRFLWTMCFLMAAVNGFTVVIDHTCTDVSNIPDYWIDQVKKQGLLGQLVGESHARQIANGLVLLEETNAKCAVQIATNLNDLNETNAMRLVRSQYAYAKWSENIVGDSSYWSTDAGRQLTIGSAAQAAAQGKPLTFSLWGWCWDICNPTSFYSQSNSFQQEDMDTYLGAIDLFNRESDTQAHYIYMTSVTDCDSYPDGPYRVTYFNDYIRGYVEQYGGILFDQADIENWNHDNTAQRIEVDGAGRTVYLRHPDYNESNGPDSIKDDHANDALCLRKAAALWHLAARLAGWNGSAARRGDINGDGRIDIDDLNILSNAWLLTSDSPNWLPYADIDLQGGDGIINTMDFAVLGNAWDEAGNTPDMSADFDHSGQVDSNDLQVMSESWLSIPGDENWQPDCNLAIDGDYEIIDYLDYSRLSEAWLAQ